jgi:YVTN family beta-propeller protein
MPRKPRQSSSAIKRKRTSRPQSAIEYLTTYGWAIIIIVIVLIALYSFGFFNSSVTTCNLGADFYCQNAYVSSNGILSVTILQTTGKQVNVTGISCSVNNASATFQATSYLQNSGSSHTYTAQCYGPNGPYSSSIGTPFKGTVAIRYADVFTGYQHTLYGSLETKISSLPVALTSFITAPTGLVVYQPTPQVNTITQTQTQYITDTVSGGLTPYHYQWLATVVGGNTYTASEANTLCGSSAQTLTCAFSTTTSTTTGTYKFEFQVTDSEAPANTQISSGSSAITVQTLYTLEIPDPYPATNEIAFGQTAYVSDSGATGGIAPYNYQWLATTANGVSFSATQANTLCGSSATTTTCKFAANTLTPPGNYMFKLQVIDSEPLPVTKTTNAVTVTLVPYFPLAVYAPYPVSNSVAQEQVAYVTSNGAYGGELPYAYQWLATTPNSVTYTATEANALCGSTAQTPQCAASTAFGAVPIGQTPYYAVNDSGNGYVYVLDYATSNVMVFSGTSVIANMLVGSDPAYAVYDSGNGYVYVANKGSGTVSVISNTVVIATVSVGNNPKSEVYDPYDGYVYVENYGSGTVSVISGTSVIATISVGSQPEFGAYDTNNYVYIPNYGSGTVSVISGTSVTSTISVGSEPDYALQDQSVIDILNYGSGTVTEISGTTIELTLSVGSEPIAGTLGPYDGGIDVLDAGSGAVVQVPLYVLGTSLGATIPVGNNPTSISLNGDPYSGYVYVTNYGSGTVTAISGSSAAAQISVGSEPIFSIANNGLVYVENYGSGTVSILQATSPLAIPTGVYNFKLQATDSESTPATANSASANIIVTVPPLLVYPAYPATNAITSGQTAYMSSNGAYGGTSPYSYQWLAKMPGSNTFSAQWGNALCGSASTSTECSFVSGQSIPLPAKSYPDYALNDSANGYVYVLDTNTNQVTVLSGNSVIANVSVGSSPEYGVYDSGNGYIYILNSNSDTVTVLSGTSVVATITVGSDPIWASYDSGNGYVYVSNNGGSNVSVISGTSVVATIALSHNSPHWSVYDPSDGYVYVADYKNVAIISGTSVVSTYNVYLYSYQLAYDASNGYVYVAQDNTNDVTILSGTSFVANVSISGFNPEYLSYDPKNGYIYAITFEGNLSIISGTSQLTHIVLSSGSYYSSPTNPMIYDPSNGYMYVLNDSSSLPSQFDVLAMSGTSIAGAIHLIQNDPNTGVYSNGNIYVVNYLPSEVAMISGTSVLGLSAGTYQFELQATDSENPAAVNVSSVANVIISVPSVTYGGGNTCTGCSSISSTSSSYSYYICAQGNWAPDSESGASFTVDARYGPDYSSIGHQSSSTCTVPTSTDETMSILGIDASSETVINSPLNGTSTTTSAMTSTYTLSSTTTTAIAAACANYSCNATITVPAGCTAEVSGYMGGTGDYGSAYIAICQDQSPGTYSVSVTSERGTSYDSVAVYALT